MSYVRRLDRTATSRHTLLSDQLLLLPESASRCIRVHSQCMVRHEGFDRKDHTMGKVAGCYM